MKMTKLSINLNKIALLRNSRGRDYPNVVTFARKFIALGVHGITIHPRQDERHITNQDALDLGVCLLEYPDIELNIEGYPDGRFMGLVEKIKPDQCTLVPDDPNQLTSDHGWDLHKDLEQVEQACTRLNNLGIRSAIFLDPDLQQLALAPKTGAARIELYTEAFAESDGSPGNDAIVQNYRQVAVKAQEIGIEMNAGHDLDLNNLAKFLSIPGILEVSIGHAVTVECIEQGMTTVIKQYLAICGG